MLDVIVEDLSVKDAIDLINNYKPKFKRAKRLQLEIIWHWGNIVARTKKPQGEKINIYNRLSEELGIHVLTLRKYEQLYFYFEGEYERYSNFLDYLEKSKRLNLNFYNVSNTLRLIDRLGEDSKKEEYSNNIERAITQLNRYKEELKGTRTLEIAQQEIKESFDEGKPIRSKDHLEWIRSQPCSLYPYCDCETVPERSQAHHTSMDIYGEKGSDYSCIPYCIKVHDERHNDPDFEQKLIDGYFGTEKEILAEILHLNVAG